MSVVEDDTLRAVVSTRRHLADNLRHCVRNFDVAKSLRFRLQGSERVEQQNLAAHQRFQMLLHGLEDSYRRLRGGNSLRKRVEIADLVFPLECAGGVAASLGRKIAEHQR